MTRTKVVIADHDATFAGALEQVLAAEDDIRVAATVTTAGAAAIAVHRWAADLLVLDTSLAGAISLITDFGNVAEDPPTVLGLVESRPGLSLLLELLEAGMTGCVTRSQPLAEVVTAVHHAAAGEASIPRHLLGPVLRELVSRRRRATATDSRLAALSPRQREILALLAGGHDQHEIAAILVISPETVRTHIQHITAKLDVHSRIQAANLALELGLVDRRSSEEDRDAALR